MGALQETVRARIGVDPIGAQITATKGETLIYDGEGVPLKQLSVPVALVSVQQKTKGGWTPTDDQDVHIFGHHAVAFVSMEVQRLGHGSRVVFNLLWGSRLRAG